MIIRIQAWLERNLPKVFGCMWVGILFLASMAATLFFGKVILQLLGVM